MVLELLSCMVVVTQVMVLPVADILAVGTNRFCCIGTTEVLMQPLFWSVMLKVKLPAEVLLMLLVVFTAKVELGRLPKPGSSQLNVTLELVVCANRVVLGVAQSNICVGTMADILGAVVF